MLTERESMYFSVWVKNHIDYRVMVRDNGYYDLTDRYTESKIEIYRKQYYELWTSLCEEFRLRQKNEKIVSALQVLKSEGIKCKLCNATTGQINAVSSHGTTFTFYATTGTITGYRDTPLSGLEEFVRMCKEK